MACVSNYIVKKGPEVSTKLSNIQGISTRIDHLLSSMHHHNIEQQSCIQSYEQTKPNGERSRSLIVKGRDIGAEIDRIQVRIKSIEKLKKQLKIQFKKDQISIPKPLRQLKQKRNRDERCINQSFRSKYKQYKNQNKYGKQNKQWKYQRYCTQQKQYTNQYNQYNHYIQQKQEQDTILQTQSAFTRLLKAFDTQIKLDSILRSGKEWFSRMKDRQKWRDLNRALRRQKLFISQSCTQIMFGLSKVQRKQPGLQIHTDISGMIDSFIQCESHWNTRIARRYCRRQLEREGLTEKRIDVGGKGYISLEDMSRFCSYMAGRDYSPTDMYMIWDRPCKGERLTYEDWMEAICE